MKYLSIPTLLTVVFLAGCAHAISRHIDSLAPLAADGSPFHGQATVLVFRDALGDERPVARLPVTIKVDEDERGSVVRGTYLRFAVPPGSHVLFACWPKAPFVDPDLAIDANFEAGKTYYFVVRYDLDNANVGSVEFKTSIDQIGKKEASSLLDSYKARKTAG